MRPIVSFRQVFDSALMKHLEPFFISYSDLAFSALLKDGSHVGVAVRSVHVLGIATAAVFQIV